MNNFWEGFEKQALSIKTISDAINNRVMKSGLLHERILARLLPNFIEKRIGKSISKVHALSPALAKKTKKRTVEYAQDMYPKGKKSSYRWKELVRRGEATNRAKVKAFEDAYGRIVHEADVMKGFK